MHQTVGDWTGVIKQQNLLAIKETITYILTFRAMFSSRVHAKSLMNTNPTVVLTSL